MTDRVHIRHLRALGYCSKGARRWCARYGFDWTQLVREGLECESLLAVGNDLATKAVKCAREETHVQW